MRDVTQILVSEVALKAIEKIVALDILSVDMVKLIRHVLELDNRNCSMRTAHSILHYYHPPEGDRYGRCKPVTKLSNV